MYYANCSNLELLRCLIGPREAKRLYQGTLQSLFTRQNEARPSYERLMAARELVQRMFMEELQHGDALLCPAIVHNHLLLFFRGREYESFVALFLDNRHRLLASEELFRGSIDGASVHPREVVKRSLAVNAAAVIFAHNHPSGVAEPSQADRDITRHLREALALVEVRVLDHIVVAEHTALSLAERGWI